MAAHSQTLRAGEWEIVLSKDAVISRVRLRNIEVLRGLAVVVRDDIWGTVPASVSVLSVEVTDHGFAVDLCASHSDGKVLFTWEGTLIGRAEGITFEFDGVALQEFSSNRIGFIAVHPLEWAGRAVTIIHPDGSTSDSVYPVAVAPSQPFLNVAGFRQATDSGIVSIDFEGDVFETEDQRNWSDASYKTYSRPLSLPFPVLWHQGDRIHQSVRLGFEPYAASVTAPRRGEQRPEEVTLRLGGPVSLPEVGLAVGPDDDPVALTTDIAALIPSFLRVDVVADGDLRGADVLRSALMLSVVPLQLAIHVGKYPARALEQLRDILRNHRTRVTAIAVFDSEAPATTERSVMAVRSILGEVIDGVRLIVGTDDNLAELNRNPVVIDDLGASAVTFCLNPGVHDLRSVSMLETPDALPAMVETARSLAGGPVVLGPLTLRPRRNLYRKGVRIDRLGRDASATDERQHTAFAAAWLIATLSAAVASSVTAVTLFEISGPRGIVASPGGARSPLFGVIARLSVADHAVSCLVDRPSDVAALGLADESGAVVTLLVANRTGSERTVVLAEWGERHVLAPFGVEIIRRDSLPLGQKGT